MATVTTLEIRRLRAEAAQRRRALVVSSGCYARQSGPDLLRNLIPIGLAERRAAGRAIEHLLTGRDWSAETRRTVREAVSLLECVGRRIDLDPAIRGRSMWHRDRLAELLAQDEAAMRATAEADRASRARWRAA